MRPWTERERALLQRWVRRDYPREVGERLLKSYRGMHRHHHDSDLLGYAFDLLDTHPAMRAATHALAPSEQKALDLALWYRWSMFSHVNPEWPLWSASRLLDDAHDLRLTINERKRVAHLIPVPDHLEDPKDSLVVTILRDLELAVLGEQPDAYDLYLAALKAEHHYQSLLAFMWNRRRTVRALLKRPIIFTHLLEREGPARRNMVRECKRLGWASLAAAWVDEWKKLPLCGRVLDAILAPFELSSCVLTGVLQKYLRLRLNSRRYRASGGAIDSRPPEPDQQSSASGRGDFDLSADGLVVPLPDGTLHLRWDDIEEVIAFKRDCFAVDQICLDVATAEHILFFDEDHTNGWNWLIHELSRHLAGMPEPDEWFYQVALPAFAPCQTVLYRKRPVPATTDPA